MIVAAGDNYLQSQNLLYNRMY